MRLLHIKDIPSLDTGRIALAGHEVRTGANTITPAFDPKQGKNGSTVALLKTGGRDNRAFLFDGCPGYARFLPGAASSWPRPGSPRRCSCAEVEPAEAKVTERFLGSPTIRVDGPDVEPGAERREDIGLKCRLYRTHRRSSGLSQREVRRRALCGGAKRRRRRQSARAGWGRRRLRAYAASSCPFVRSVLTDRG